VVSRQRAWGVPITIFVKKGSHELLQDERVNTAIADAFMAEGADAWFADKDGSRFLTPFGHDPADYDKVTDVLDVWFDSGCTHAFTLEVREDLRVSRQTPLSKLGEGGPQGRMRASPQSETGPHPSLRDTFSQEWEKEDTVMYLEGSDQHRGWFHSSLIESCGTRGHAPYDIVLTHGFVLDEKGEKMSKSRGNVVAPQDVIKQSGADILRLWVAASDYADDLRIGPEIIKTFNETYRKLRNTVRWMLGSLHHFHESDRVAYNDMPELEHYILHRLWQVGVQVREAYEAFDTKRVVALLNGFMTGDLSSFYFDIRKDALYCDPISSIKRKSALTVVEECFRSCTLMLAPILAFTAEEAWMERYGAGAGSVHQQDLPVFPPEWQDDELSQRWTLIRRARRVVTGALELERAAKTIGSSLEAAPVVFVSGPDLLSLLQGIDFAEICITSDCVLQQGTGPESAFRSDDGPALAVLFARAEGAKCARSWKISADVGADPAYPDVTLRDAQALRERNAAGLD
jgi:isoleucyl-tRNA synthetase